MAVRSGFRLVRIDCADHYLNHGDSGCRFHGQLSGDHAILRDQRLYILPEPSHGSEL